MKRKLFLSACLCTALLAIPSFSFAQSNDSDVIVTNKARKFRPSLDYEQIYQALKPRIEAIPSVRGVQADAKDSSHFTVYGSRNFEINMMNLRIHLNTKDSDRAKEYDIFLKSLENTIVASDPVKVKNLRILVRTKSSIDDFEKQTAFGDALNIVITKPFIPDVDFVLSADSSDTIAFVPQSRLLDLGLDEDKAFEKADKNMQPLLKDIKFTTDNGVNIVKLDGSYEASLLAVSGLNDLLKKQYNGDVIVAIPNRSTLAIARADNIEEVAKLISYAKNNFNGNFAITPDLLYYQNNQWQLYNKQ